MDRGNACCSKIKPGAIHVLTMLYSTGKIIITDRLHGSIFSFLMYKPHVFVDQIYKKIEKTREVAFNSSQACGDKMNLMYESAKDLNEGIDLAVSFLDRYYL